MLGLGENLRPFGLLIVVLVALDYDMVAKVKVEAWTYNYSTSPSRDWNSARQFCRQHYTDMVAIQNQKEIAHLNEILPPNPKYYWIGIRKVGSVWTWVGTNKTMTKESENWAAREPNNKGSQEDCVEIYIKRPTETAKWNDEKCTKEKGTICYNASCSPHACSSYGECVETIGNYSCSCQPGFQGPRCEEAQRCRMLTAPPHGNLSCSHPHGNFSFNSSCDVRCEEGYFLNGTASTRCGSLGTWTETPGMCQVVRCNVLTPPHHGTMHCNHPLKDFSYSSTCWLGCEEGFILKGANFTQCTSQGIWSSVSTVCEAQRCRMLTAPPHGNLSCSHPHGNFSFNSSCDVRCEEGYFLNGTASTRCGSLGTWTETPGMCQEQCDSANATDSWRRRCRETFSSYWCHCKEDFSEQNCKVDFRDFLQVLGGPIFIPTCCLVICVLCRRKRKKKHHTRNDSEPELQVALQSALESSAPEDTASQTHKLLSC